MSNNTNSIIQVSDHTLIPVYKIIGCRPDELKKYSREYILRMVRDYYRSLA